MELNRIDGTDGIIPANTPVVLKYMQDIDNGYVFLKVVDSDKTLDATNHIKGALADKVNDKNAVTAGKVPYTLQPHAADNGLAVAFMQYEGSSLEGFRATSNLTRQLLSLSASASVQRKALPTSRT